ncbi:hypothetical protein ElyMa_006826700 [Elysia marginata]|uniref:Uncharacterized protein n=1 Tax=Elysia marginata TaxID=1093978 RepID=A0AAV4J4H1_9GAST|nr:hypothetical protein ElyMa_006826700 [Elysia marginata]
MYKQHLKNILSQDRSSFPLRDYPQEEVMAQQQLMNVTQHPAVMELTGADVSSQQQQFVMDDLMLDQPENIQYFANTNVESFAAAPEEQPIVTVSEMVEKISELEKSNSSLHSKIDNLTLELQNFRKDFASQFQELKQKLFDADQTAAKAVEQHQQKFQELKQKLFDDQTAAKVVEEEQQNQPKSPKSVKFAIDEDTNPRKRPSSSSSDEQQPATKKPAFGDDTVAFSQKFVKGKTTTSKKKDPNVIQDLILVLVWIMKLSRLFCEVFKLQNLSEIEEKIISSKYAYRFARWLNRLKEGLNEKEEKLVQTLAKRTSTEDLQKFKTGSSFCNSDKNKQILDTSPALFTDDYDFGNLKLTKISYVSTLLAIFTKHGTTLSALFRALREDNDDEYIDLIFKKLHSAVSAFKFVTELGNLACICTSCKTRVVDVFCDFCKYMSVCSVCYNKTGYVKCAVCKTKMNKVVYGYKTETPINSSDKSTSALYSSSVRTIPQIQAATRNFSSKHKTSGLIGKTCDSDLKPKDDTTKTFVSFVTSVENALMKSLGAVETLLKQGNAKGLRLCDSCRSTVATKRLRYRPANTKETVIAVCDGCFEDKTENLTDDSPFIRFQRDCLYRGANMSLTAATLQLDLSSVPLDSRHRGYLKKDNKRSNADAVCTKYNIDAQSRSQEDSVLTLKTVLKQIVSWGADKDHDMKTYFDHVNENMALCWPVNNNHLIQVDENETKEEVDRELFFNKSTRTLIQPQSHEKKQGQPQPYVKQILQILKVETDNNKKIAGLKSVLKESDVCVCNESVIVIGKLFRRLESSKLLSDLDEADEEDCQIVGFYNKEFHPHPKNLKKKKRTQPTKAREEEEDLNLSEGPSSDEEEQQQQEQESATDTLTNLLEQV